MSAADYRRGFAAALAATRQQLDALQAQFDAAAPGGAIAASAGAAPVPHVMPAPAGGIVFVCWKWASGYRHVYTAEHVNVMRAMVARHYKKPHRFVCITDDPTGVEAETFPLWEDCSKLTNASGEHLPSCYRRLKIFDPATQAAMGIEPGTRIVSLDLDTVICGDLTPLVDRGEEFVGWALKGTYHPRVFNGSMFLLEAGKVAEVWADFDPESSPAVAAAAKFRGSDQSWLSYRVGVDRPGWTKANGIVSYALDLRRSPDHLPTGARVVMFHGHMKPWHLHHVGRPAWVREHWRVG